MPAAKKGHQQTGRSSMVRLEIDSFKAYESQAIDLGPFTVVIGENGAGKTTLLQAIEFLGSLVQGTLSQHLDGRSWDYADLPHLRKDSKQFGFAADFAVGGTELRWELTLGARRRPGVARESVTSGDGTLLLDRQGRTMSRLDRVSGAREEVKQTLTASWLSTVEDEDEERFPELVALARWARADRGYLALDPSRLRARSRSAAHLGPNGESLAGVLRSMIDAADGSFDRVVASVRRRYKPLVAVQVKRGSGAWNDISVTERRGEETVKLNARQVSDGLLRLLAIATLAEAPRPPSIVMIDEVENGVHPHLLGALVGLLQEVADRGVQVVLTTHSPIALNFVRSADQVVLARRGSTGPARLVRLSETPGYERLGAHFDVGELWYNLGEEKLVTRPSRSRRRTGATA